MSYSLENRQNSTSVAMFASVGIHAVLFVAMAFFPATRETVKKPLRIVNLLPPDQLPTGTPDSQVKTSTLQDILNNPLPDLSAGLPPLGNTSTPPDLTNDSASSYVGEPPPRVNTALNWTNPPIPSVSPTPPAASSPSSPGATSSVPPSSIVPAPEPRPRSTPNPGERLPDLPDVAGAFPSPFGSGETSPNPLAGPQSRGPSDSRIGVLDPSTVENIPPSRQRVIPVISETVAFNYPEAACRDQLQGTATITYYRQPNGTYVDGSSTFENRSGHAVLDDAALNAVIGAPAVGTGAYQRYSSRFDFLYSDAVCSAATGPTSPSSPAAPQSPAPDAKPTEKPPGNSPESSVEELNPTIPAPQASPSDQPTQSQDAPSPETPASAPAGATSEPSASPQPPETPPTPAASPATPPIDSTQVEVIRPSIPEPAAPSVSEDKGSASDLVFPESAAPEPPTPVAPAEPLQTIQQPPAAPEPPAAPPLIPTDPEPPAVELPQAE